MPEIDTPCVGVGGDGDETRSHARLAGNRRQRPRRGAHRTRFRRIGGRAQRAAERRQRGAQFAADHLQQLARQATATLGVQGERRAPCEILRQPRLALTEVTARRGHERDRPQHAAADGEGGDDIAVDTQARHGEALVGLAAHDEIGGVGIGGDPLGCAGVERARHTHGCRRGHGPEQYRRARLGGRIAMHDGDAPESAVRIPQIDRAPIGEQRHRQPCHGAQAVGGVDGGGECRNGVGQERGAPGGGFEGEPRATLGFVEADVADRDTQAIADQLEQARIVGAEAAAGHARGVHDADHAAVDRERYANE